MSEKKHNPGFVTLAQCKANVTVLRGDISSLNDEIKVIKRALVGDNLQGGLVKKMNTIEANQRARSSFWKVAQAITIAVVSAMVTAAALGALSL